LAPTLGRSESHNQVVRQAIDRLIDSNPKIHLKKSDRGSTSVLAKDEVAIFISKNVV
tara:strand:+ start:20705 stop:20875 length:171 start_codon:yes stop_codon:yes gene_type:complete